MTYLKKTTTKLFLLALLITPIFYTSAAALIDLGELGLGIYGETKSNVNTNTNVNTNVNTGVNTNFGGQATSSGNVNVASPINASAGSSIESGQEIRVLRKDVKVAPQGSVNTATGASVGASTAPDGNANAVVVSSDLKTFAEGTMRTDADIEEINFTSETVEVAYKQNGKLLGLFPVTFTVTATAMADGTVEVRYPLYAFVVAKDKDTLETELESAVAAELETGSSSAVAGENSQAIFNASEQARVAASMQAIFKRNLSSSTTTTQ